MADKIISFGQRAAERTKNAVIRIERQTYGGGEAGQRATVWNPGVIEAVVSTTITACNGNTYGQGNATVYIDNANSVGITDAAYNSTVVVLNWYVNNGASIGVNTHIMIGWRNGNWRLVGADC
jgi:hypothetical protein